MISLLSNKLYIYNPDVEIIDYCYNNLILANPEYEKKKKMNLWLGGTPKEISYYQKVGQDIVLPFGSIDDLNINYKTEFTNIPAKHILKNEIKLYNYQEKARDEMVKAKNGLLIAPTGSGKTVIAMSIIAEIGLRTLFLTHTEELLQQAIQTYKMMFECVQGDIGVIKAGKIEVGNKITFALVQTLSKKELERDTFGCIVCDEVQFATKSLSAGAMFSRCVEMFSARYKIGMTAARHRADGQEKRIDMLFGHVKHEVDRAVVSDKIMKTQIKEVMIDTPSSFEYLNADGTLNFCELMNYLAINNYRNDTIAEMIKEEVIAGHSCIVLCDRVEQIKEIYFRLGGYAVMVTGTTKKDEREKAIADMRTGEKKVLIASTKLAGAGLDIPVLSRLLWVSIQKDYSICIQAVGRIARADEGKAAPVVYDIIDKNIGYCLNAYKNNRKRHYKKISCNIIE